MGRDFNPGVDWVEIKQRLEAGESQSSIAKDLTARGATISQSAISRMARKKGWLDSDKASKPATVDIDAPLNKKRKEIIATKSVNGLSKRSEQNRAMILQSIVDGSSITVAAARAGMSFETLRKWRMDDEALEAEIIAATGERDAKREHTIQRASDSGDWRASLAALTSQRKEVYGGADGQKQAGITVNINVPEPKRIDDEGVTIDVTPTETS